MANLFISNLGCVSGNIINDNFIYAFLIGNVIKMTILFMLSLLFILD